MTDNKICFISGANRGIGYEFAVQLIEQGWTVIAGYRSRTKSAELLEYADNHSHLHAIKADVVNERHLRKLRDYLNREFGRLDLLINNAGINPGSNTPLNDINLDLVNHAFVVNVLGPLMTTRFLHPLLAKSDNARIVNIGSRMGSVELSHGDHVPYRISKGGLNMLTAIQSESYKPDGITTIVMTPGWVRTDMGGQNANLSTEESVKGMLNVIENLTPEQSGKFFDYTGEEVVW